MIDSFIRWLEALALVIPLPLFVFIGSILEEIVAPVPSPLVMSSAGSIIGARDQGWLYLLIIAAIGSVGKTLASLLLYYFSDKLEDFLVSRFGSYFKISHQNTEGIGQWLSNRRGDGVILTLLRAIPLFPSAPISIFCGAVKLDLKTYLSATFIGTTLKNIFYLYAGLLSLEYLDDFRFSSLLAEEVGYVVLIVGVIYFLYRHKNNPTIWAKIKNWWPL